MKNKIIQSAKKTWDYHHMNHQIKKSDCIFVLGSHDTRVAEKGAQLFLDGYAPYILFSGGLGRLTEKTFDEPEADKFAKIAINMGVPSDKIIIENKSTNTGENIKFSYDLLKQKDIKINKFILVQKPYMERRTYATFKKQWPGKDIDIFVTSPDFNFETYPNSKISLDEIINIMVGDLQRIKEYPTKGFQIHQEIPDDVWEAYEYLVSEGFDNHLIY
jgi:uncharacterized SAM-binding protein YcdF (DUF218 family)